MLEGLLTTTTSFSVVIVNREANNQFPKKIQLNFHTTVGYTYLTKSKVGYCNV